MTTVITSLLLLLTPLILATNQSPTNTNSTTCFSTFPTHDPQDCPSLIQQNLLNPHRILCSTSTSTDPNRLATLTHGSCSITTVCLPGERAVMSDAAATRGNFVTKACTRTWGSYRAQNGTKTCLLPFGE